MATPTEWLNEFQVNTGTAATGSQSVPQILGLNNGHFVVAWQENAAGQEAPAGAVATVRGTDIVAKIYDAEGNVVRDSFRLNSDRNFDDERDFDLTATHDGFAMAYIDDSISNTSQTTVYYERFDFDGTPQAGAGTAFQIADENVAADNLFNPQVAANLLSGNDDAFVAFTDSVGTNDDEVIGRVIDEAGAIGAEFDAGSNSSGQNRLGDVAVLSSGNFVSVYTEDDTVQGIEFTIVGPTGAVVSNVNVSDSFGGTSVTASDPAVASLAGGGFVVTWVEGNDILARAYSNEGLSLFNETVVAGGANNQNEPVVVGLPDGDFVVAWDDDTSNNLFARRFNADGTSDGFTFTVENVNVTQIDISATGDGRILFAWLDLTTSEISASVWDPRSSTIDPDDYNTELANVLDSNVITTRTTSTTVLAASDNEDYFVFGQSGNDLIFSNGFGEYLGGAGNDTITAGNGTDGTGRVELLDGGAGVDTLDITTFGGTYGVNLATGVTTFGGVVVTEESFINFENVNAGIGSNTIVGTSGANVINAGAGNDDVDGGGGDDIINGGAGNDILTGGSGVDTLIGGAGNDTLEGDTGSAASDMSGGDGDDTFLTRLGNFDTIAGGDGTDTLILTIVGTFTGNRTIDIDEGYSFNGGLFQGDWSGLENLTSAADLQVELIGNSSDNILIASSQNDTIFGEAGNDTIEGRSGNDTIDGGAGDDTVFAGAGDDTVNASSGVDTIFGGTGNDTLFSSGTDTIFGEDGNDTIHSGLGLPETLDGGDGVDTLDTTTFNGAYVVDLRTGLTNFAGELFVNFENITAGNGSDELFGFEVDNIMIGGGGNDRILAFRGNDTLEGGLGDDTLNGGEGNDSISGGDGADTVYGQDGNDIISGGADDDELFGEAGNDTISGGAGNDTIGAANGFDVINAGAGNDTAFGGEGNDTVSGGTGNDRLFGSGGSDFVDGEDGDDQLFGETGADTLRGGDGDDQLNGGGGNDFLDGENGNDRMFGGSNDDRLEGGSGNDLLDGQSQDDELFGQSGNDSLFGGDGFDFLDGGTGDDRLFGGSSGDTLIGGRGVDTLFGGNGFDTFVFTSRFDSTFVASDLINGIEGVGAFGGDIIDLSGVDADGTTAGNQSFTFLGAVSTAVGLASGPGSLWVENVAGQTRLYAELDNDGIIEFAVRINDGAVTAADYTAGDFIL